MLVKKNVGVSEAQANSLYILFLYISDQKRGNKPRFSKLDTFNKYRKTTLFQSWD